MRGFFTSIDQALKSQIPIPIGLSKPFFLPQVTKLSSMQFMFWDLSDENLRPEALPLVSQVLLTFICKCHTNMKDPWFLSEDKEISPHVFGQAFSSSHNVM